VKNPLGGLNGYTCNEKNQKSFSKISLIAVLRSKCIHRPSSDANSAHSSPEEANAKSAP